MKVEEKRRWKKYTKNKGIGFKIKEHREGHIVERGKIDEEREFFDGMPRDKTKKPSRN